MAKKTTYTAPDGTTRGTHREYAAALAVFNPAEAIKAPAVTSFHGSAALADKASGQWIKRGWRVLVVPITDGRLTDMPGAMEWNQRIAQLRTAADVANIPAQEIARAEKAVAQAKESVAYAEQRVQAGPVPNKFNGITYDTPEGLESSLEDSRKGLEKAETELARVLAQYAPEADTDAVREGAQEQAAADAQPIVPTAQERVNALGAELAAKDVERRKKLWEAQYGPQPEGWTRPNNTNVSKALKAAGYTPSDANNRSPRFSGHNCQQSGDVVRVSYRSGANQDHLPLEEMLRRGKDLVKEYAQALEADGYTVRLEDDASTLYVIAGKGPKARQAKVSDAGKTALAAADADGFLTTTGRDWKLEESLERLGLVEKVDGCGHVLGDDTDGASHQGHLHRARLTAKGAELVGREFTPFAPVVHADDFATGGQLHCGANYTSATLRSDDPEQVTCTGCRDHLERTGQLADGPAVEEAADPAPASELEASLVAAKAGKSMACKIPADLADLTRQLRPEHADLYTDGRGLSAVATTADHLELAHRLTRALEDGGTDAQKQGAVLYARWAVAWARSERLETPARAALEEALYKPVYNLAGPLADIIAEGFVIPDGVDLREDEARTAMYAVGPRSRQALLARALEKAAKTGDQVHAARAYRVWAGDDPEALVHWEDVVEAGAGGSGCGEAEQGEPRTQRPSGTTCPECLDVIAQRLKDAADGGVEAVLEHQVLVSVSTRGGQWGTTIQAEVLGLGRTRTGVWQVAVPVDTVPAVEGLMVFPADATTRV